MRKKKMGDETPLRESSDLGGKKQNVCARITRKDKVVMGERKAGGDFPADGGRRAEEGNQGRFWDR